ncbi:MAG: succinate dehydrogenase, hydrophobic membrane anchor protein [Sphingomonadaceae bacterium]
MRRETPLGRARGLGSSRHGAEHWWAVRVNSVAALGLYVWLLVSLVRLPSLDHESVTEWLAEPLAAVPMLLLVAVTFWHIRHGLQEVIDDYVHDEGNRFFALALVNFFAVVMGALAAFSVLEIAFAGAAA